MRQKLIALSVLLLIVLLLNFCTTQKKQTLPLLSSYASLNDTVKYVGKETCRSCHAEIYNTFMQTGMGKSFDVASKQKTSAKFSHAVIYDKYKNFYYHPFWQNDSLHLLEFRLENGDTVYKRNEVINFIIGSGQHTNSHIINTNGYLNQAPATFYTQKGEWHLPPGFEDGNNTRFSRIIGLECMSCHNSYPDFVLGSENKYNILESGINCERCHGPGEYHVQQKLAGILVDTAKSIDFSIVNPAKLSIDLQFDVCMRCHLQGNAVLNSDKSFFDFKPGMKLSDVMNVFVPLYEGNGNAHIMASHAERLKQSRCYIETANKNHVNHQPSELRPGKNALTCITCHNPHVSVRQTNDDHFNAVCKNCHHTENSLCTEKLAVRSKSNDNCISCHMTFSGTSDIPHVSIHDHKISIPSKDNTEHEHKVFKGIYCVNNPSADRKSRGRAFIAYFERYGYDTSVLDSALNCFSDAGNVSLRENINELVQIYFLKNDFAKVIELTSAMPDMLKLLNKKSYSNTHAWTAYRIGASFQAIGKIEAALPFYKRAAELAPYHLDVLNKYATALSIAGNVKEAQKIYEFILKEYPKHVSALTNLGFIFLSEKNDPQQALAYYNKALALNPDYEPALMNMAGLMHYMNRNKEAIEFVKRILKISPNNEGARQLLNQLKST
ncbi:MAG TPA: tetratricopeptide repeat protein [Bacteroidia bacterium]|nr:tetratricopeptide repeat protein [Bacteroidia bacterium]